MDLWVCSSVVERHSDKMEAVGSIPTTPKERGVVNKKDEVFR